jgi:hypothetical protein
MPELYFKGKEFVYSHNLTVPYRPMETQPDKSILPPLQGEGRGGDGVDCMIQQVAITNPIPI